MFGGAEVWVLFMALNNEMVMVGSYQNQESCQLATARVFMTSQGKKVGEDNRYVGFCVPADEAPKS